MLMLVGGKTQFKQQGLGELLLTLWASTSARVLIQTQISVPCSQFQIQSILGGA